MTEPDSAAPNDPTIEQAAGGPESGDESANSSIKDSYRAALARKSGQNSHVEQHLAGRRVGAGNNDTHKRQFRRKSG